MSRNSLTVPKFGGGSAARMLAELNAEHAAEAEEKQNQHSVDTDIRKHGSTDSNTEARKDSDTDTLPSVETPANTEARKEARTSVSTSSNPPARTKTRTDTRKATRPPIPMDNANDFLSRVRERLTSREPLEGGAKTTVEYSENTNRRLKQYCLDKGKAMNGRLLAVALVEAFLEEEGY